MCSAMTQLDPQSIAKDARDWEHVSATYGLTLITLEQKFKSRWHSQQPHNVTMRMGIEISEVNFSHNINEYIFLNIV